MATYHLKCRVFTLLGDGTGKSIGDFHKNWKDAGGLKGTGKSFKEFYRGSAPNTTLVGGSAISQGATGSAIHSTNNSILNAQTTRSANRSANIANSAGVKDAAMVAKNKGYNSGFTKGRNSVGAWGGLKNTYKNAGTLGKAGIIGAGLGTGYVLGKGLGLWGNKKN